MCVVQGSLPGLIVRGAPWSITDAPRFTHRGVLIDSSRHFLPISVVLDMIDALSYNKLNVLHWHLVRLIFFLLFVLLFAFNTRRCLLPVTAQVDAESFAFNSTQAPNFIKGAYSRADVYSPADLEGVVSYARDRGVRVMLEVDTPGHTASWRFGYPNVIADWLGG